MKSKSNPAPNICGGYITDRHVRLHTIHNIKIAPKFEFVTMVATKSVVFWDVRIYQIFRETLSSLVCSRLSSFSTRIFFVWQCGPTWAMTSLFFRFLDHTQRRTTGGRIPLDEWSARRRHLSLTIHNTHETDVHVPGGIRTRNPSKRATAHPRRRPLGNWDRLLPDCTISYFITAYPSNVTHVSTQTRLKRVQLSHYMASRHKVGV